MIAGEGSGVDFFLELRWGVLDRTCKRQVNAHYVKLGSDLCIFMWVPDIVFASFNKTWPIRESIIPPTTDPTAIAAEMEDNNGSSSLYYSTVYLILHQTHAFATSRPFLPLFHVPQNPASSAGAEYRRSGSFPSDLPPS
jgi:hypothetical protein